MPPGVAGVLPLVFCLVRPVTWRPARRDATAAPPAAHTCGALTRARQSLLAGSSPMLGVSEAQVEAVLNRLLSSSVVIAAFGWNASLSAKLNWGAEAKKRDGNAARAPRDATDAAAAKLAAALTAALAGAAAAWLAPTSPLASGLSMVWHAPMLDAATRRRLR